LPLFYIEPPTEKIARATPVAAQIILPSAREEAIMDDRDSVQPGDNSLLIVEDDPHYARVLLDWRATRVSKPSWPTAARRRSPWRGNISRRHHAGYFPAGHARLDSVEQLKLNSDTRHIPVQIVSVEEEQRHGLSHGAFSYTVKPATTKVWINASTASKNSWNRT